MDEGLRGKGLRSGTSPMDDHRWLLITKGAKLSRFKGAIEWLKAVKESDKKIVFCLLQLNFEMRSVLGVKKALARALFEISKMKSGGIQRVSPTGFIVFYEIGEASQCSLKDSSIYDLYEIEKRDEENEKMDITPEEKCDQKFCERTRKVKGMIRSILKKKKKWKFSILEEIFLFTAEKIQPFIKTFPSCCESGSNKKSSECSIPISGSGSRNSTIESFASSYSSLSSSSGRHSNPQHPPLPQQQRSSQRRRRTRGNDRFSNNDIFFPHQRSIFPPLTPHENNDGEFQRSSSSFLRMDQITMSKRELKEIVRKLSRSRVKKIEEEAQKRVEEVLKRLEKEKEIVDQAKRKARKEKKRAKRESKRVEEAEERAEEAEERAEEAEERAKRERERAEEAEKRLKETKRRYDEDEDEDEDALLLKAAFGL